jgi:LysM repeat protein
VVPQNDGPNVLRWSLRGSGAEADNQAPHGRRRRRSSALQQWLPIALAAIAIAVIALLFVAMRALLAAPAPAQPLVTPAPLPALEAAAPAAREALAAPGQNTAPAPTAPPTPAIRFSAKPIEPSYTIGAGDNLWSIAQKNHTTAAAIQSINNLPEGAMLNVGQKLVMP